VLRRRLKAGIASAFYRSGVDRCIGGLITSARTPVIVGYHRVIDDVRALAGGAIPAMLISVVMLERQLDWIGRRFRVVSLDELAQRLERGEEAGPPPAAITFDDGYRDVYDHALPLLERKGMPAAVFVTTGLTGTREVQLHDRLYLVLVRAFRTWRSAPHDLARLLRALEIPWPGARVVRAARSPLRAMRALFTTLPQAELHRVIDGLEAEVGFDDGAVDAHRLLSWDMVRDLHRAGIVIGSHTRTHALLTNETAATVREETAGSRRELEARLGVPVRHFAYPDGRFDPRAVSAVAAAGYRLAFTTCRHRDRERPALTIPRTLLWERSSVDGQGSFSPAIMSCQVRGVFDLVTGCRDGHGRAAFEHPAA